MRSRTVFWLVAALMLLALRQDKRWNTQQVFDWDAGGYYSYLPATFLYHDPGRPDSLARLVYAQRDPSADTYNRIGLHPLPHGRYYVKYPLGLAVSQAPWFAGAHLYSRAAGLPDTGDTWPYQEAVSLAGAAYALLGLWLLRKLLLRYYPDRVTAWVLAGVGLGTNYFVYSTHEAALSQATLFLWQVALLFCTARWYETPERRWALGMGLFLGLATLTRFTEGLYALVPLCWGLGSRDAWQARPRLLARHAGQLGLAAGLAAAIVSWQLLFWHWVSGRWVLEIYTGEHFNFTRPQLLNGLFSIQRGWLVYTPLAALMLAGIFRLRRYVPAAVPAVLVAVPAVLYVTFSWSQWYYGWGFSSRPLVSLYPLLALPFGAALAGLPVSGPWRLAAKGFVGCCIALNLWQGWQYVTGVLPGEVITWEVYKDRFWMAPPPSIDWSTPSTPRPVRW